MSASAIFGGLLAAAPMVMEAYRYNQNRIDRKHAIYNRVADAKSAGIHPLAALGFSGYQPQPISVNGSGLQQIGQNLMMKGRTTKEEQLIDAQINQVNATTDNIRTQTALMGQGSNITHDPNNMGQVSDQLLPSHVGLFSQQNIDPQGRVWETPSQSLQEAVSDEAPFTTQMAYEWSILSDKAKVKMIHMFPKQARSRGELARFYDNWIKTRPYEKGYIYRWDFIYGWIRHKQDGSNALFVVDAPEYKTNRFMKRAKTSPSKHKRFPGWQGK